MTIKTHSTRSETLYARRFVKAVLGIMMVLGMFTGSLFLLFSAIAPAAMATETAGATADEIGSEETTVRTEKLAIKVNQVVYLPLDDGSWSITNSNTSVVKVGGDGAVTAKKVGKTKLTCVSDAETVVFDVTVSKSNFKPVAITKLQCYKSYRKYMTKAQFKKAYNKALKMVLPAGDLSKKEQLRYVTGVLRAYFDQNMSYTSSKPHYNDPYGYLCLKRASCAGCARTTGLCLNILGIKYEHVNENKWTHQWCRVKVGSQYWIADPYGMYCGKEPAKRKHPYL